MEKAIYKSPLNFTGGKHKLIPALLEHFPEDVETFYDVFAGGLSVTINSEYDKVIANDIISPLIRFYEILQREGDIDGLIEMIKVSAISKTDKEEYYRVREEFNKNQNPYLFFYLVSSCTNNMVRFNSKGEFNQSFGYRTVNKQTIKKLTNYYKIIQEKDILFTNYDYKEFLTMMNVGEADFVYLDPPYTLTDPRYYKYWTRVDDHMLCSMLEMLNYNGVRFVLSNVREHNGVENPVLDKLKKYKIIDLENDYEKAGRIKNKGTIEMIVKNF
jgi:DNA adenine methylase Dam